jgi:hypothetical protein
MRKCQSEHVPLWSGMYGQTGLSSDRYSFLHSSWKRYSQRGVFYRKTHLSLVAIFIKITFNVVFLSTNVNGYACIIGYNKQLRYCNHFSESTSIRKFTPNIECVWMMVVLHEISSNKRERSRAYTYKIGEKLLPRNLVLGSSKSKIGRKPLRRRKSQVTPSEWERRCHKYTFREGAKDWYELVFEWNGVGTSRCNFVSVQNAKSTYSLEDDYDETTHKKEKRPL